MRIETKDGSVYNLSEGIATELRGTFDIMSIHEIFEDMKDGPPPANRYEVWIAVGIEQ